MKVFFAKNGITFLKNPFVQAVERVGDSFLKHLPYLDDSKLNIYMLYKFILLLLYEKLSECNMLICFVSCPFPGVLSILSDFHVYICTIAVLIIINNLKVKKNLIIVKIEK